MKISDYLKKDFCIMDLAAANKEDAITEIANRLASSGKVNNVQKFVRDILERESLGSTGIGRNVAIPHSRTDTVDGFVIGFGRSKKGIDFKSLDGEKVNFVFLMGTNPGELNFYLRLLAELSRLLMEGSFRRELFAAASAQDIIEAFKRFEEG